jgi:glycogen(starch) synthase
MTDYMAKIPRRILMTADTVGGVWVYAMELCRGLCSRGIEVVLAAMPGELSDWQRDEATGIDGLILHTGRYKLEWMEDSQDDVLAAGQWLMELQEQYEPELIHLNNYAYAILPWRAPVMVVGHSCIASWWEAVHGEPAPNRYVGYRQAVKEALGRADVVVAPSWAMLECLKLHHGPLDSAAVIYNGRTRPDSDLQHKEEMILSVGRLWDKAKNTAALEEIAGFLPWPVYIAGCHEHPDGSRMQYNNLKHLGVLSPGQLAYWYGKTSIYVLPARYEPFGLSVLEAAMAGCALVLGDIASLRELWLGAAVFVHPDDSRGLLDIISGLIKNRARCDELALCAYCRAQQFGAEKMIDEYVRMYGRMMAGCVAV